MVEGQQPGSDDIWNILRRDKLQLLSVIGSVSSIVALAIVFLEKISSDRNLRPEIAGWRALFITLSFFGIVAVAIFTFQWARAAYNGSDQPHITTAKAGARIAIGLLLIGFCLDGFFSATYWTPWLAGLPQLLREFRLGIGWQ